MLLITMVTCYCFIVCVPVISTEKGEERFGFCQASQSEWNPILPVELQACPVFPQSNAADIGYTDLSDIFLGDCLQLPVKVLPGQRDEDWLVLLRRRDQHLDFCTSGATFFKLGKKSLTEVRLEIGVGQKKELFLQQTGAFGICMATQQLFLVALKSPVDNVLLSPESEYLFDKYVIVQ